MGRKNKKVIARILAVLMAFTLLPFDLWGSADVVMAEELLEVCTEETADVEENSVDEKTDAAIDTEDKSSDAVLTEEMTVTESMEENSAFVSDDNTSEDTKKDEWNGEEEPLEEADNKGTVDHVHNFTVSGKDSTYYTITGNLSKDKGSVTYNDLSLTQCLKLESSTNITFNAEGMGKLTLVFVEPAATIKIDGTKYTAPGDGIISQNLTAGNHTIAKANAANLFYMVFSAEAKDKASAPVAAPAPQNGEVEVGDTITLSCTTSDATIYYTTDGSEPKDNESKNTYSNGITIESSMVISDNKITIKAYAEKDGYDDSDTETFEYTVSATPGGNQLEKPIANPSSGEVPKGTKVTLESNETEVSIYYTTDGTLPSKTNGTLFSEAIEINEETIIKAVATKEGKDNSFVAIFTYTIKKPKISLTDNSEGISCVEIIGDISFRNQDNEEVFDVILDAQKENSPQNDVIKKAEELKEEGGMIYYYDFSLVNAEITSDSQGTINIKMPYSIASGISRRNKITVLHNVDDIIDDVVNESDGFSFSTDSFSPFTIIVNPAGAVQDIAISKSAGYEEGAYAEWKAVDGADGYMAYVAPAGGKFERIDDELIREYSDHWRVDTVGLAKGTYYLRIDAVSLETKGTETTATVLATNTTDALKVTNYDRSGFAFSSNSTYKTGSGAYKEDGTLRDNAKVIYVTAETAKTVTLDVQTDSKGKIETFTGIQSIINAKQKGCDTTPWAIRIIGCVTDSDLDAMLSSAEGLQIKGKGKYSEMNITLEGIGEDAVVKGFGFLIRNCGNVELRNFGILYFMDDGVSVDSDNTNIWIHDLDIFYGKKGSAKDQVKGDGSIDVKAGSTYVTVSYNHFWDSGKCSLCGMKDDIGNEFMVTYHHNWFDHSDSRHPRIRGGTIHIYNNYFDGNSKYGVGVTTGSSALVESNYFRNCKYPMMSSMQGTDAIGEGTFSGEDGGMIKAYNNAIVDAKSLIYANAAYGSNAANATSFDAYLVSNRLDTVPDSIVTIAGRTPYNNFDTNSSYDLGVTEDMIDVPENVPTVVMEKAGRLNGGDFKWKFDNATEDANSEVIDELHTAVANYKASVKKIGSGIASDVKVVESDDSNAPGEDSQKVSPPIANKLSGTVEKGTEIILSSSTDGAKIYYTLNGLDPTKNSDLYEKPFIINQNTTIKAIAIVGQTESEVRTFKYTLLNETIPEPDPSPNPGGDGQPENTTIVKYEFNPELIGFNLTDTETDSSGTVKQIYKMPADDTVYGDYFTIGNNSARSGKIAKTSTSGKTLAAPNPSKSDVTGYNVRYQFSGTADDPRAIRFTTKNKARVSVAAYRVNDNVRDLYLDTDDNVKTLTRTATEYTFDIVEAGSHSVYAKDGDIAILYVIVEEFVPITDDNVEVKEPYSMLNQGEVPKGTSVELKCDTTGAIIYFTTDGTDPTEESTVYTSPIPLGNEAKQVVIKAIAVKDNVKSEVVSFTYTVSADIDPDTFVSAPVSDVASGKVSKGTKVTLTSATTGAKIYYTTDGTDPTPRDELLYKAPIVINEAVTIKAISVKGENTSSVVSFVYTISAETSGGDTQNIAAPKAIPGDGAQFPSTGGSVELACDTDGATIYYTMSSTENGLTDPADDENTERKEYNNTPIPIKEETYIWAVAVKDGAVSEALKCHYIVLAEGAVVQPTATPGSSEVASGTKIALSTTDPVDNIFYTMGSTPAATADPTLENSGRIVYDAKTQIVITEAVTIKAVAQKGGKYSDVATFTYTVVSGGTENPEDPEVKTIKLEECEITVPAIIRNTSKKADANQPSVTYVTYKYTDGSGEEKHVKFAEGEYLDYKVVWNGAVEGKENTYSVTLTGLGREEDQFKIDIASTITKEYKVIDKPGKDSTVKVIDISKAKVNLAAADIKNVVYTGYAIEPKLDYSKDKDNLTGKLNIAYKNNVNAGKATVILSAKPELNDENTIYIGSKTLTFNIKKAALNKDNAKATAKVYWDDSFSMTSGHDYTGTPVVVEGLKVESGKGRTLRLNTDYTVTYKNNARAGKATVTVKGIGNNLSGSWTQNFTINPVDLKTLTFSVKELPYSPKGAKLAAITAKNAAGDVYTLKEGVDYTAKYTYASKTKEAGSKVTVSISGKGACTGKDIAIGELDIVKGNFAECITVPEDIAVDGKDLAKELAKAIVVTDASGVKLVVNKDYTIETSDKGSKTVTINPVDTKNYKNACSVPYRVAINLAKDKGFVFDKNKEKNAPLAYDGRNPVMLTADIINEYVGSAYQLGKNIEIVPGTYKNNTKKGTAQVTVRGKAGVDAGFYGQKVLKFKIVEK